MTKLQPVEDAPGDFEWPEPLVIEIVAERYPDIVAWPERLALSRLQANALREGFAGRDRQAAAARLELIAFCAARGIGPERIAKVDQVVCRELSHLVATRFRTSPRTSDSILHQLDVVLDRLGGAPRRRQPAPAPLFRRAAAVTG